MNSNDHVGRNAHSHAFDVLGDIDNFMNSLFSNKRTIDSYRADDAQASTLTPPVDVVESETAYKLRVELAGVAKEDLKVTIDEGVLKIEAERKDDYSEEDGRVLRRERRYGKINRSLKIAEDVVEDDIVARYDNGVLTLSLPKSERQKPRRVDIHVS